MKVQLTKRLIESAKPQAKPYELRDVQVRGLLLRVQSSGHKAWICEWTRGKPRTLGALAHLSLEQARSHATKTVAEYVQTGLPSLGKSKAMDCTLGEFLDDRYAPWALTSLKSGKGSVERMNLAERLTFRLPSSLVPAVHILSACETLPTENATFAAKLLPRVGTNSGPEA